MRALVYTILSLVSFVSHAQEIPADSLYFGLTPPGGTPEKFAPGIISLDNRNDLNISFSPDSNEVYYGTNGGIFYREYTDNSWSDEKETSFSGFVNPNFSVDGNKIYLTKYSADFTTSTFWMVKRTDDGWTTPELLPATYNSGSKVGNMTESSNGNIYFDSNNKIWQTLAVDSFPTSSQNLGTLINSTASYSPCIATDGSYLIFNSEREDKIGNQDLYISFKKNNEWIEPINMNSAGVNINVKDHSSISPSLSPDGRYLFYNFHDWAGLKPDIYWVSTEIIDDLKDLDLSTAVSLENEEHLTIFPNPAHDILYISNLDITNKILPFQIINIDGKIVQKGLLNSEGIDISSLNSGVFIITINTDKSSINKIFTIK